MTPLLRIDTQSMTVYRIMDRRIGQPVKIQPHNTRADLENFRRYGKTEPLPRAS